nr:bifunctional 4-hydroxy-2-oxoglutarate aldolase/2-dehydro-3-deoxy-phosphogluconate aldolase [Gemmiger qucibialis]
MNSVLERVYEIGIIPVIAFNSVDEAIPLCKALMDGGLPAAEVTFRTACAEECIKKIHEELPDMLLGAGTVLTVDQADRAMAAGASFIVAPGFDPEVCKHVIDKGGIMMPGTATSGEMQQAMNMGCEVVKFFPAEANGGVDKLKNIGAALKTCKWMCTGGVNAKNVNNYLGYNQIIAVGGTWMCK